MAVNQTGVGPYSRPAALAKLDGRTRAARLLRDTRRALLAHVGETPSATERALVDRATMLTVHLALMDEKALRDVNGFSERDGRQYLAWSNSLERALRRLGLDASTTPTDPVAALHAFASRSAAA